MTANAVANHLQKKVLLVTVSVLVEKDLTKVGKSILSPLLPPSVCLCPQDLLRFLFREAKIHNAVLFFDECEMMFESRESRNSSTLGLMLTEVTSHTHTLHKHTWHYHTHTHTNRLSSTLESSSWQQTGIRTWTKPCTGGDRGRA